jgi:hypothetical protein
MIFVKKLILGDMEITFRRALQIVGVDEFNVYLVDRNYTIDGLPYIQVYSKEWKFIGAETGRELTFEYKI